MRLRQLSPRATVWTTDESGQISVYLALMLLPMLLFFFAMLNVGQLVFERTHLQVGTDAGALAGASVQAVGLNEIADVNLDLHRFFLQAQLLLATRIWCERMEPELPGQPVDWQERMFNERHRYMQQMNREFAGRAYDVAQRTVELNLPASSVSVAFGDRRGTLARLTTIKQTLVWLHFIPSCRSCPKCGIVPAFKSVDAWVRKDREPTTSFAVAVSQAAKPALAAASLLREPGQTAGEVPGMQAAAAARPGGGWIEHGQPAYRARLVWSGDPRLASPPPVANPGRLRH